MNDWGKVALITLAVIVALFLLSSLFGGWGPMGGHMGWGGAPFWGIGIGLLFMLLFWGLILLGLVFLVRGLAGSLSRGESPSEKESALDILKKRYARGEIGKEEFEEKKRGLL